MTPDTYIKAQIAGFAHREAAHLGGAGMTAIACILRNRVRAGWYGGDWLENIDRAYERAAYRLNPAVPLADLSPAFRQLLGDVEDIFHGTYKDELSQGMATEVGKPAKPGLYYMDPINAEHVSPWFLDNILRNQEAHPRMAQVGTLWIFS